MLLIMVKKIYFTICKVVLLVLLLYSDVLLLYSDVLPVVLPYSDVRFSF